MVSNSTGLYRFFCSVGRLVKVPWIKNYSVDWLVRMPWIKNIFIEKLDISMLACYNVSILEERGKTMKHLRELVSQHIEAHQHAGSQYEYELALNKVYEDTAECEFKIGDVCYLDTVVRIVGMHKDSFGIKYAFEMDSPDGHNIIIGRTYASQLVPVPTQGRNM